MPLKMAIDEHQNVERRQFSLLAGPQAYRLRMELRRAATIVSRSISYISKRISATLAARRPGCIHAAIVSTCEDKRSRMSFGIAGPAYAGVSGSRRDSGHVPMARMGASELRKSVAISFVIYLQIPSPLQRFHNQDDADPGTPLI